MKDLVKITPGKRKKENSENNQSSKKTKVGSADYTKNQPEGKTSFEGQD